MIIHAECGKPLVIGIGGEDQVTAVTFDISTWVEAYGPGSVQLVHRRSVDPDATPVPVTFVDGVVTWPITAADTAYQGVGEAQLIYTPLNRTKKSEIFQTVVDRALTSPAEVPIPMRGWVQQVMEEAESARADAEAAAEAAESSAESAAESARTLTIDRTLAKQDQPADAKVVGDQFRENNAYNVVEYHLTNDATNAGITFSWQDDGTCRVTKTGTHTAPAFCTLRGTATSLPAGIVPGKTYRFSIEESVGHAVSIGAYFYHNGEAASTPSEFTTSTSPVKDITVPQDADGMIIRLRVYTSLTPEEDGDIVRRFSVIDCDAPGNRDLKSRNDAVISQINSGDLIDESLFPAEPVTKTGVTFRWDPSSHSWSVYGTATAATILMLNGKTDPGNEYIMVPGGTYYIDYKTTNPNLTLYIGGYNSATGTYSYSKQMTKGGTIKIPSDNVTSVSARFRVENGSSVGTSSDPTTATVHIYRVDPREAYDDMSAMSKRIIQNQYMDTSDLQDQTNSGTGWSVQWTWNADKSALSVVGNTLSTASFYTLMSDASGAYLIPGETYDFHYETDGDVRIEVTPRTDGSYEYENRHPMTGSGEHIYTIPTAVDDVPVTGARVRLYIRVNTAEVDAEVTNITIRHVDSDRAPMNLRVMQYNCGKFAMGAQNPVGIPDSVFDGKIANYRELFGNVAADIIGMEEYRSYIDQHMTTDEGGPEWDPADHKSTNAELFTPLYKTINSSGGGADESGSPNERAIFTNLKQVGSAVKAAIRIHVATGEITAEDHPSGHDIELTTLEPMYDRGNYYPTITFYDRADPSTGTSPMTRTYSLRGQVSPDDPNRVYIGDSRSDALAGTGTYGWSIWQNVSDPDTPIFFTTPGNVEDQHYKIVFDEAPRGTMKVVYDAEGRTIGVMATALNSYIGSGQMISRQKELAIALDRMKNYQFAFICLDMNNGGNISPSTGDVIPPGDEPVTSAEECAMLLEYAHSLHPATEEEPWTWEFAMGSYHPTRRTYYDMYVEPDYDPSSPDPSHPRGVHGRPAHGPCLDNVIYKAWSGVKFKGFHIISDFGVNTEWSDIPLKEGATPYDQYSVPGVRTVGDQVYIRGAVNGNLPNDKIIGQVPAEIMPYSSHIYTVPAYKGSEIVGTATVQIKAMGDETGGNIIVLNSTVTLDSTVRIQLDGSYFADSLYRKLYSDHLPVYADFELL